MSKIRIIVSLCSAAAFSGCVSYQPRELSPATLHVRFESRTFGDAGLARFLAKHGATDSQEWDLSRLTLAAFYFSPELDVARAQFAEAEAGIRTARQLPNPTLSFAPGYNADAVSGVTPWILSYALDLTVETAGKRSVRTAEATHRANAAKYDVAKVAWGVRGAVHHAMAELSAAQESAEFWRAQGPLLSEAARLVDLQVKAGEVSPLLGSEARIAVNRAELAVRESERLVVGSRSRLAEAIGVSVDALTDIRISFRGLSDVTEVIQRDEARKWAAENRSDLLSALSAYAASQSALQLEIARQYPDLSFGPSYQLDQGESKWTLGLGFTIPAFHRNQGPIAAAMARREIAAAQFIALQSRVMAEVDRGAADYAAAVADMETIRLMRQGLVQQAKTIQAQQAAGETSRLDLARAQIVLSDNSRAELEARQRASQALVAFEVAVQRPLGWAENAWRENHHPNSNTN